MRDTAQHRYDPFKRALDILGALVGIVLTAPAQLVVGVAVWWKLGRPVLFCQPRPGKNSKVFILVKFRTMSSPTLETADAADGSRLDRFGQALRKSSLDELPTLWNVLRGDMSLIGPRPLLVEYLPLYTQDELRRHEVRPGVTGLAQVSGRNSISWEEKFAADLKYVDERGIGLDARIAARTLSVVLRRKGVSSRGEATMRKFTRDANLELPR